MEQSMSLETDCKSVRGKVVDKIWSSKVSLDSNGLSSLNMIGTDLLILT